MVTFRREIRLWRETGVTQRALMIRDDADTYAPARTGASGMTVSCHGRRAHTGDMGRIIGIILGAILAIWLAVTAAGGIFATLKTFLIIGLIAMAVFLVVWLVARGTRRG